MNFMGCHFCHEELFAILLVVPFFRAFVVWARSRYHRLVGKPRCGHEEHTCHDHTDMTFTGPPGVRIAPGTIVKTSGEVTTFKLGESVTIGPDGKEVVAAIEVKA